MNILIIEDEQLAAEKLTGLIKSISANAHIVACLDSIESSVNWLTQKKNSTDLIFMDIHLADGLCFSIFEKVKLTTPVIFTTAYDQYAIQAFKFNSIDYLLKPITAKALQYSIEQYESLKTNWQAPDIDYSLLASIIAGKQKNYKQRFLVKQGNKFITIPVEDVFLFFAEEKYIFLITSAGKKFIINFTLDELEDALNPDLFIRANRKFILNINSIKEVYSYYKGRLKIVVPVLKDAEIIISNEKAGLFKSWLEK